VVGDLNEFRAQLLVPAQRALFDYWSSCSVNGQVPRRAAFSPSAIPQLLPYVSLIDVEEQDIFRIRLAGTQLRDVFDGEITGLAVGDLERISNAGYWHRACLSVVETLLPTQGAIKSPRVTKDHLVQFWLRLPFLSPDGGVKQLLGFDICIPSAELMFDLPDCDQGEPDLIAI
jgi:hypothetical protein